ncbi:MAG TPA: response regulator [Bacteroidota bacterium]
MESDSINILIIDDDLGYVKSAQHHLKKYQAKQFNVTWKDDGPKGIEELVRNPSINVVLMDHVLPTMTGLEVIRQIRDQKINVPIIFLTSNKDYKVAVEAIKSGAEDYLAKDEIVESMLPRTIVGVLERSQLKKKISEIEKNKLMTQKRSEAIRELVVTVCHEFNNPLAAIKISVDILARQELSEKDRTLLKKVDEHIEQIEREITKLRDIQFERTDQVFSDRKAPEPVKRS